MENCLSSQRDICGWSMLVMEKAYTANLELHRTMFKVVLGPQNRLELLQSMDSTTLGHLRWFEYESPFHMGDIGWRFDIVKIIP